MSKTSTSPLPWRSLLNHERPSRPQSHQAASGLAVHDSVRGPRRPLVAAVNSMDVTWNEATGPPARALRSVRSRRRLASAALPAPFSRLNGALMPFVALVRHSLASSSLCPGRPKSQSATPRIAYCVGKSPHPSRKRLKSHNSSF